MELSGGQEDMELGNEGGSEPTYRMITTFNAQLTKWTFLLCGIAIGFLFAKAYLTRPVIALQIENCVKEVPQQVNQQEGTTWMLR